MSYDAATQPHEAVRMCDVCGRTSFTTRETFDRYGFTVSLNECACGLVFLSPRMTPAAYADFYEHHYRPLVAALRGYPVPVERMEKQQAMYAADIASWMGDLVTGRIQTLLDVGGSTGVVAQHFKSRFAVPHAIVLDPSPSELARAKAKGLDVIAGLVEEVPLPKADLILLCQTVDHLLQPRNVLKRLGEALTPQGWLFVDIVVWRAKSNPRAQLKVDHPYYFTSAVMRDLLHSLGFVVRYEEKIRLKGKHRFLCQMPS